MKNIVSGWISGYLETLVQPLKSHQIDVDVWNGKLRMENLTFREDGLINLGFPLKVIHGKASKMVADFSWNKLETEPVIVTIKDVFLLTEFDWQNFEQRQPILPSHKINIKTEESEKKKIQTIQAFLDFTNKIIGTIQLTVENIHIVVQIPLGEQKVSIGFTLSSVKVDDNEKSNLKNILKNIKFSEISIYIDTNPHVFDIQNFENEFKELMDLKRHQIIFNLPLIETTFFRSKEKNVSHNNIFQINLNEIIFGLDIPQLRSIVQIARSIQLHSRRRTYKLLMALPEPEDFANQFKYVTKCAIFDNRRLRFNVTTGLQFLKNRSKYYKIYDEEKKKGKFSKKLSSLTQKLNDETNILLYNYAQAKYKLDNKNYTYKLKDDETMNFIGNYSAILESFKVLEFHVSVKKIITDYKDSENIIRFSSVAENIATNFIYTKQLQKVSFSLGSFSLYHDQYKFISGIGRGSSKFLTAASDLGLNMVKANADFGIIEIRHVEPFIEQFIPFLTGMSGSIPKTKIKFRTLAEPLMKFYNVRLPDISVSLSNLDVIVYSNEHSFNFCLDNVSFSNNYAKRKKENVHLLLNIKSHFLFDKKPFLDPLTFDTSVVSTYHNTKETFTFHLKGQFSDINLYINPDFLKIVNDFMPTVMKVITNEEFIKSFKRIVETIKKWLDFKRETDFKLTFGSMKAIVGDSNLGFGLDANLRPFAIRENPKTGHIFKVGMKSVNLYSLLDLSEKYFSQIETLRIKFTNEVNLIQIKDVNCAVSLRIYDLIRPVLATIAECSKIGKVPIGFPTHKYKGKIENINIKFLEYAHKTGLFNSYVPKISWKSHGESHSVALIVPSVTATRLEKTIFNLSDLVLFYRQNESENTLKTPASNMYKHILKGDLIEKYDESVENPVPLVKAAYNAMNFNFDKDFIPLFMNNLEPLQQYIPDIAKVPAIIEEVSSSDKVSQNENKLPEDASSNGKPKEEVKQQEKIKKRDSEASQISESTIELELPEGCEHPAPAEDDTAKTVEETTKAAEETTKVADDREKTAEEKADVSDEKPKDEVVESVNDVKEEEIEPIKVRIIFQFSMVDTVINIPEIKTHLKISNADLMIAFRGVTTMEANLKILSISQDDIKETIFSYEGENFLVVTTDEKNKIHAKYASTTFILSPYYLALIINYFYSIFIPRIKLPDLNFKKQKKSFELPPYDGLIEMEKLKIALPQKDDEKVAKNFLSITINSWTSLKPNDIGFSLAIKDARFENGTTKAVFPPIIDIFSIAFNYIPDVFKLNITTNEIAHIQFTPEVLATLIRMSDELKDMITETNRYFDEIPKYNIMSSLKAMPYISLKFKPIYLSLCSSNPNRSINTPFITFRAHQVTVQTACQEEKSEYVYAINTTFDIVSSYVDVILSPCDTTITAVAITDPKHVNFMIQFIELDPIHACVNERLIRALASYKIHGELSDKVVPGEYFVIKNYSSEKIKVTYDGFETELSTNDELPSQAKTVTLTVSGKSFTFEQRDIVYPLVLTKTAIMTKRFKKGIYYVEIYSPITLVNSLPFPVYVYNSRNTNYKVEPGKYLPIVIDNYSINDTDVKTKTSITLDGKTNIKQLQLSQGRFVAARTRYRRKRGVTFVELEENYILYNCTPFDLMFSASGFVFKVDKGVKYSLFNFDPKYTSMSLSCCLPDHKPPQESSISLVKSEDQFIRADFGSKGISPLAAVNIVGNKIVVYVAAIIYNTSQHTLMIDTMKLKPGSSAVVSAQSVNLSIDGLTKPLKTEFGIDNSGINEDIFLPTLISPKMTIAVHISIKRAIGPFSGSVIVTISDSLLVINNLYHDIKLLPMFDVQIDPMVLKSNTSQIMTFVPNNYKFAIGDEKIEILLGSPCNKIFKYKQFEQEKFVRLEVVDMGVLKKVVFSEQKEAPILIRNDISVDISVSDTVIKPNTELQFAFPTTQTQQILCLTILGQEYKFSLVEPLRCSVLKKFIDNRMVMFNMVYLKTGQLLIDLSYEMIQIVPDFLASAKINLNKFELSFINKSNREILVLLLDKLDVMINFDQTFVSSVVSIGSFSIEDQNPTAENPAILYNEHEDFLKVNVIYRYDVIHSKIIPFVSAAIQPIRVNLNQSLASDIYNYILNIEKIAPNLAKIQPSQPTNATSAPIELSLPWIEIRPIEIRVSYNKDKKRKPFYGSIVPVLQKIPFFGLKKVRFPGFFVSHFFGNPRIVLDELATDYVESGVDESLKQFGFLGKLLTFFGINGYIKNLLATQSVKYITLDEVQPQPMVVENHELIYGVFNQYLLDAISRAILSAGVGNTYLMEAVAGNVNGFRIRKAENDFIIGRIDKAENINEQQKVAIRHKTPIFINSNYIRNFSDAERSLQKILCNANVAAIFFVQSMLQINGNYFCITNDTIYIFDRKLNLASKIPIDTITDVSLVDETLTIFTKKEPIVFDNDLSKAILLFISTKVNLPAH